MKTKMVCRRNFLRTAAVGLGSAGMVRAFTRPPSADAIGTHASANAQSEPATQPAMAIQQVIDTILRQVPGEPLKETVDTVKAGDPSQAVKGIVTTFLATRNVVAQTVQLGANFIITHEPTFYNHVDGVEWLTNDPVYLSKKNLIETHRLVVWRFHDHIHRLRPDGIMAGVLKELEWEPYADRDAFDFCTVPAMSLSKTAGYFKKRLKIEKIQIVGDETMPCSRIAFAVGAAGRQTHVELLERPDVDVLVVGEINEWETSEYVRDAVHQGMKKALIVLGHAKSEEAGMKHLAGWLRPLVPGVPITHVPAGSPFVFV